MSLIPQDIEKLTAEYTEEIPQDAMAAIVEMEPVHPHKEALLIMPDTAKNEDIESQINQLPIPDFRLSY